MKRRGVHAVSFMTLLLLCSCRSSSPSAPGSGDARHEIRFLISFDDGPSAKETGNPTRQILDQLDHNDLQPGVKAMFFVQTLHPRGGGSPRGREIMRETIARGHVLGLHSVSPEGHISHTSMKDAELVVRLRNGRDLLRSIQGDSLVFVRPPFGARTLRTRGIYEILRLPYLASDLRARDGIIYGFTASPRRRSHIRHSLEAIRAGLVGRKQAGREPWPVVMEFHDLNPYTARKFTEYLHILVEEAERVGLKVADPPFYADRESLERAALRRQVPPPDSVNHKR